MVASDFLISTFVLLIMCNNYLCDDCKPYLSFPNHTMCIYKKKACTGFKLIKSGGLTKADKNKVIEVHNQLRKLLVDGKVPSQPQALNMSKITWDKELEIIAQRAADQCVFKHDAMRYVPRFKVGQNIHKIRRTPIDKDKKINVTAAILSWWNEYLIFNPENIDPFKYNGDGTGHYSQIAWAVSSKIGCGYVMFSDLQKTTSYKLFFCNYGPRGNVLGDTMYIKRVLN